MANPVGRAPAQGFQPMTRCQYVLASVVNLAKIVKSAVLTVFWSIAAVATLGLSKKVNEKVLNAGWQWTSSASGLCLTAFGAFCPGKMNTQFQVANA